MRHHETGDRQMDNVERKWLQRELDDIKGLINGKPCDVRGELLAANTQAIKDLKEMRKEGWNWRKLALTIWLVVLSGVVAVAAIASYIKS